MGSDCPCAHRSPREGTFERTDLGPAIPLQKRVPLDALALPHPDRSPPGAMVSVSPKRRPCKVREPRQRGKRTDCRDGSRTGLLHKNVRRLVSECKSTSMMSELIQKAIKQKEQAKGRASSECGGASYCSARASHLKPTTRSRKPGAPDASSPGDTITALRNSSHSFRADGIRSLPFHLRLRPLLL